MTRTFHWTNSSVVTFAEGEDPVEVMEAKARELALKAMDDGWKGPPFDPLALAQWLNMPVEARGDIPDARTVPTSGGKLLLEYNPMRPRGRLRFSIAHEIAHSLFVDCADEVRNRGGGTTRASDNWQLESDIKPANCMRVDLDDNADHIKLIDFGLARDINGEPGVTQEGVLLGSPETMAPELISTKSTPDARSDIYSLGATLYKLLTGRAPFAGEANAIDTLSHPKHAPPRPPSQVAPDREIPENADGIVMRALARDPGQRFATAEELADVLRVAFGKPRTIPPGMSERPRTPPQQTAHAETASRYVPSPERPSPNHPDAPVTPCIRWSLAYCPDDRPYGWLSGLAKLDTGDRIFLSPAEKEIASAASSRDMR